MTHFFNKVLEFCKEYQAQLYILIIVAALAIGTALIWGGESMEKAKKRLPWVAIGALLIAGAVTLGADIATKAAF